MSDSVAQVKEFSSWLLTESGNFSSVFSDRDSLDQYYRSLGVIYSAAGITCSLLNAEVDLIVTLLSSGTAPVDVTHMDLDVRDLCKRESAIRNAIETVATACAAQLLTLGPKSSQVMCAIANEHPAVAHALSELGRE
jgi:hypothetical protein